MSNEPKYNSEDYGFNFDINNIEPTTVGNYGNAASPLYGIATAADTALTAAAVFAGGAGLAKAGIAASAKLGLKEALKAFVSGVGKSLVKNVSLGRASLKTGEEGISLGLKNSLKSGAVLGNRKAARGIFKNIPVEERGLIAIGGKTFNITNRAGKIKARAALEIKRTDIINAIKSDVAIMGLLGIGTATSVQGLVGTVSNIPFTGAVTPPEVEMMSQIIMVDDYVNSGDLEKLFEIQKNMYDWGSINSSNFVDILGQGMGESSSDNMFWIQTRLAMASENSKALGINYVPKDASEVILTVDELNNLYSKHSDASGGVESQGLMWESTLTDDIKKAQTNKYDFIFNKSAYYLKDKNGVNYRVDSEEYYTAFNDYSSKNGNVIDWTKDVSEGEITNAKANFEKNEANWKTENVIANGIVSADLIPQYQQADRLKQLGIYDLSEITVRDGKVFAAVDFGVYKANDPIPLSEEDYGIANQAYQEYNDGKAGVWDAALGMDTEEGRAAKAAADTEVDNNLITAKDVVKTWYEDNGLKYNEADQYNIDAAKRLANAGLDQTTVTSFYSDTAKKNEGYFTSKYGAWAPKLLTGDFTVKSWGKAYTDQIEEIYGIQGTSGVNVNDPLFQMIFKADGSVMTVQEAQRALKQRPSYEKTAAAAKEYGALGAAMMERYNVGGGSL